MQYQNVIHHRSESFVRVVFTFVLFLNLFLVQFQSCRFLLIGNDWLCLANVREEMNVETSQQTYKIAGIELFIFILAPSNLVSIWILIHNLLQPLEAACQIVEAHGLYLNGCV